MQDPHTTIKVCPHCGNQLTDLWELFISSTGTIADTKCPWCWGPLRVEVVVSYHVQPVQRLTPRRKEGHHEQNAGWT